MRVLYLENSWALWQLALPQPEYWTSSFWPLLPCSRDPISAWGSVQMLMRHWPRSTAGPVDGGTPAASWQLAPQLSSRWGTGRHSNSPSWWNWKTWKFHPERLRVAVREEGRKEPSVKFSHRCNFLVCGESLTCVIDKEHMVKVTVGLLHRHSDHFIHPLLGGQVDGNTVNHQHIFLLAALQLLLQLVQQRPRASRQHENRTGIHQARCLEGNTIRFSCSTLHCCIFSLPGWSPTPCAMAHPNPFEAPVMMQTQRPKFLTSAEETCAILSNNL